ncbi:galactose-1-phosphate uridylyltransferase [Desertimonas flava]|jgi:UDPglucose--hexose-1-phosphate uridylyltransferase|uniref:galactose-1-phosphate uridylyltransferase n=1 Tax=Desertimonas flava TaxID=2064846 RepID=UPI001D0CB6F0|nr:galactose-1-phosphate uridylyltransferase [Desertimonas flava]
MRLNPLNGRWVTIVSDRAARPNDFAPRDHALETDPGRPCPFCPGNEEATLPALETVDEGGHWQMRVVPNIYPAFYGDTGFVVHHVGPVHVTADATGIHEVFIYTPDHQSGLQYLSDHHAAAMMQALKRRLADHAGATGVRYTQVIVNHGREAGASLAHPHAQILGLPFVPTEMLDEERAFARFAGGCVICTTIEAEETTGERVVFANDDVVAVAPFWSGAPYELLLMPRRHEGHLQHADDRSLDAMGVAIRDAVGQLNSALGDVSFNLGVHSAPHEHAGEYHWHVHLWPNLVTQAGFERGTGVMINVVDPESAAESLRSVRATA